MLIEKKSTDYSFGMLPDDILCMILEQYGYTDDWVVLPFINVNRNAIAINKRSETARKAVVVYQEHMYIIKEIPWYTSSEKFTRFEMAYQEEVRKRGSKVPKILENKLGRSYAVIQNQNQTKYLFVQEYLLGGSWDGSDKCIASAAQTLAQLHNHSLEIKDLIQYNYDAPQSNVYQLAQKMLDILYDGLDSRNKLNDEKDIIQIEKYYQHCMQQCIDMEKEAINQGYRALTIPVHGDYNPWNLILNKNQNEVIGVIDFDNAILDNPIHDVSEAILDFCYMRYRTQSTRFLGLPKTFQIEYAVKFLLAYKDYLCFDFNQVVKHIKSATTAVAIELFTLGLVRGDYNIQDCPELLLEINNIPKYITEVLDSFYGYESISVNEEIIV